MMTLNVLNLRIEKPRQSLASTMSDMRSWLDSHRIELAGFTVAPAKTGIVYDIRFRSENEANQFGRAFN